jgi:hypothetical protein
MRDEYMKKLNSIALENELRARRLSKRDASRRIGRSDTYLSMCINTGNISEISLRLLESELGIKRESILEQNPVESVEVVKASESLMDRATLYKTIYLAVRNGVTDALNGDSKHE